jgi:hypothetical protein
MNKTIYIICGVILFILIISPVIALANLTDLISINNPNTNIFKDVYVYTGPNVDGDNYVFGNCTWWVAYLKIKEGDPIPNSWGNAATWNSRSELDGYKVDHSPSVGSIMQDSFDAGGLGHVAMVTSVDIYGNWTISEMNYIGLDIVDSRSLNYSQSNKYNFIHKGGL